ncbi:hypothetical protein Sru01_18700 [Sphaerisporangium rufum]|uniref:Amidotransferase n=1 Tax=Sphaerisporangium rufum TaxID=1381558 RepID=A0A919V0N0_9ACTN|nr:hypothetical protein [Sphaerisporangium rufum]GII76888.1 hypothetical protein Sru01_18700 [Sphaerisporangium rufum]
MSSNWTAVAMVFLGLFMAGGVVSFLRQGIKIGAVVLGVGAALAVTAGVMWW